MCVLRELLLEEYEWVMYVTEVVLLPVFCQTENNEESSIVRNTEHSTRLVAGAHGAHSTVSGTFSADLHIICRICGEYQESLAALNRRVLFICICCGPVYAHL